MPYRTVLDLLPLVLAVELDIDNRVLWMSRAALDANDCRIADVRGIVAGDIWPEDERVDRARFAVRRTGEPQTIITPATLMNGRQVWLSTTLTPQPDGRIVAACIDVSAKVQSAALRAVSGIRCEAPRPAPAPAGALLFAGYDLTDVATALAMPVAEALAICADIAGTPLR